MPADAMHVCSDDDDVCRVCLGGGWCRADQHWSQSAVWYQKESSHAGAALHDTNEGFREAETAYTLCYVMLLVRALETWRDMRHAETCRGDVHGEEMRSRTRRGDVFMCP